MKHFAKYRIKYVFDNIYWAVVAVLVLSTIIAAWIWTLGIADLSEWPIWYPLGLAMVMAFAHYYFSKLWNGIREIRSRKRMLNELNRHRPEGR
jgi:hypothetical protein